MTDCMSMWCVLLKKLNTSILAGHDLTCRRCVETCSMCIHMTGYDACNSDAVPCFSVYIAVFFPCALSVANYISDSVYLENVHLFL